MRTAIVMVLLFCTALGSPFKARASDDEIKISINSVVYLTMFAALGPAFTKTAGIKITYMNEPGKIYNAHLTMQDVTTGRSDVGISAVSFDEWSKVMKKLAPTVDFSKVTHRVIGKDVISIMTSKDVGVTSLSDSQLEGIFAGRLKNWKQVGGADLPITLVLQTISKSRTSMFQKLVLGEKPFGTERVKDTKDNDEAVAILRNTPGTIAFIPKKGIDLNGLIIQKTSEIGRPFTMVTAGKPSEKVFKLIRFIETEGKRILAENQ